MMGGAALTLTCDVATRILPGDLRLGVVTRSSGTLLPLDAEDAGMTLLEARQLTVPGRLSDVSFALRQGR